MWQFMKNEFHVSEIFASIEGEGKRTGYIATFVRLTGCNLRCSYCDTKYAQHMGADDSMVLTEDELLEKVVAMGWKKVTITGGEPLLHDIQNFVIRLSNAGFEINIETNGAVKLLKDRPKNLFYTMDWKCPSSGENGKMLVGNLKKLTEKDVLKFVVGNLDDLEEMNRIIGMVKRPLIYVSPVFNEITPAEIVEYVKQNKLANVCTQVQLHKIVYRPDERGV